MSSTTRQLGKGGPQVSALGFGLLPMSVAYGTIPSTEERFKILDRAVELGVTFWDTADIYGDSEKLVGEWFKKSGKRDQVFLATKFGLSRENPRNPPNSSAKYCRETCERSLGLLGIDSIDLYYLHLPHPETPIEESVRAMVELKAEGKIKHIGLSNVAASDLRRAAKITTISALQVEYSPFLLDVETSASGNLLATARELGIAVVCYAPMGRGMVTSKFAANDAEADSADMRALWMPRFMEGNKEKNVQLVRELEGLASKRGCSVSQLALAWLMKQGDDIIPIPGTKRLKYLEENWAALKVQLSDEDEKEIRAFVEKADIAGGVVPPGMEGMKFRETVKES